MSRTNGHNASRRPSAGFTLVEIIVAVSVSAFVFAGILSAYMFLGRNLTRTSNTQQLEEVGRRAFYLLNQDVGMAVSVQSATGSLSSSSTLNLTLPSGASVTLSDGTRSTLASATTISYVYNSANGTLTRAVGAAAAVVLLSPSTMLNGKIYQATGGVTLSSFSFKYYNKAGTEITPSAAPGIKEVEMTYSATLGSSGSGTQSRYTAVSPRVILRNSPLLL